MIQVKGVKDQKKIIVQGAREHNLKNISIEIPRGQLVVVTGVSGSGKTSLVFDTIFAEGQRRYVESLSSYARQFLERMHKPDVDLILGISPAVAIEQKTTLRNSRSTVGTTTEIYDYLRLIFARVGKTFCINCNKIVTKASMTTVIEDIESQEIGSKWMLGFPLHAHEGRKIKDEIDLIKKRGFFRIYYKGKFIDLSEENFLPDSKEGIYIVVERFKISKGKMRDKLADSIEIAFREGESRIVLINQEDSTIREHNKYYECCGIRYEEPEPRFFSFNNPFGACPVCQGFSKVVGIDMNLVIPNPSLSIVDGAIAPWRGLRFSKYNRDLIQNASKYKIPVDVPFRELTETQVKFIKTGFGKFIGLDKFFEALKEDNYKMHIRIMLSRYNGYTVCTACNGGRLRREALQVKIGDNSIYDVTKMPINKCLIFFKSLVLSSYDAKIADLAIKEIIKRLSYLNDVGLGYLTLDRYSSTLSGGETQRINLATALGSALVGTLYVLDEPSIGLHPRDNAKLIKILKNLRDLGNTVLVVEHDPEMMREADMIVDVGPRAGKHGGEIIFQGNFDEIISEGNNSLTGDYLSGRKRIPLPNIRDISESNYITIEGAFENNLKDISVKIPLNKFVVVTGVSGSGKSSLVHNVLYGNIAKHFGMNPSSIGHLSNIDGMQYIKDIEIVDQSSIGKTPRSNPISYIKAFEIIRDIFAATHAASSRGYKPGFFSFNVPGGRCEDCQGDGFIKVEMQFLADLYLECESCKGTRFKKDVRDVHYRGKNVVDVLNMTVDEAVEFFHGHNRLLNLLRTLSEVGLGYIQLGQPSNTLSGGEAQRVKLATKLTSQNDSQKTLYIFDEPTTGLHYDDIQKLINCFQMLIKKGHSVVIIEHNLEIIKCADHVIEMGPEAGDRGGEIVVTGTPEDIVKCKNSWTGKYLKDVLKN